MCGILISSPTEPSGRSTALPAFNESYILLVPCVCMCGMRISSPTELSAFSAIHGVRSVSRACIGLSCILSPSERCRCSTCRLLCSSNMQHLQPSNVCDPRMLKRHSEHLPESRRSAAAAAHP